MTTLRPYQSAAIDAVLDYWGNGPDRIPDPKTLSAFITAVARAKPAILAQYGG